MNVLKPEIKLTKDGKQSVRFNKVLLKELKKEGWSVQKLFDYAIKQVTTVDVTIKGKTNENV